MSNVKLKDINGNDIEYPNVKLFIRDLDNNFTEFVEADNAPIPSLEGTAIPVGEAVERIYFNTNLTVEETTAYLSQLTYVQTELTSYPLAILWACVNENYEGHILLAMKVTQTTGDYYQLLYLTKVGGNGRVLYSTNTDDGYMALGDYWAFEVVTPSELTSVSAALLSKGLYMPVSEVGEDAFYPTDFNGLPIGLENEKIKNVLSITPFVAEGIIPSGTLEITKNGTYPVTDKEEVVVDVPIPDGYVDRTEIDKSIADIDNIIGDVEHITDLAGKKFLLKQSVAFSDFSYNINFEVSHAVPNTNVTRYHKCNKLIFATDTNTGKCSLRYNIVESSESAYVGSQITIYEGDNESLTCFSTMDDLRLISIIDGKDTTNETLVEWFNTYADLVPDFDTLTEKLEKLVVKANETTGKNDATVSGAVDSLNEGYGLPEISTEAEMNALEVGTVFKYVGTTTEAFENGAYYVVESEGEEATLISFTIDGTSYQAESGMTWGEWCDSDYNTGSYHVSENLGGWVILNSTSWVVPNGSYDHVYGTDVIISGGEYAVYDD